MVIIFVTFFFFFYTVLCFLFSFFQKVEDGVEMEKDVEESDSSEEETMAAG